jgi:hypothetical protein
VANDQRKKCEARVLVFERKKILQKSLMSHDGERLESRVQFCPEPLGGFGVTLRITPSVETEK